MLISPGVPPDALSPLDLLPLPLPPQIPPKPIPPNLLPLHPLPRHGQLSPQPLETALIHPHERPVHFILILFLHRRDLPHHTVPSALDFCVRDVLRGGQRDVPVLVVMNVYSDRPGQRRSRWVEQKHTAPPPGEEVLRRCFRCREKDCYLIFILCGSTDGVCCGGSGRVVFAEVRRQ